MNKDDNILILKGSDIKSLLGGCELEVIKAVRAAYELHGQGKTELPQSVFLRFPDNEKNRIIALPAYLGGDFEVAGLKWISSFPQNLSQGLNRASAIMVLNSATTGRPEVILEGSVISAQRTAASAALAARQLSSSDSSSVVGLIGCGVINFEVARFLQSLEIGRTRVMVFDLDRERAAKFRQQCSAQFQETKVEIADDIEFVLANCDLISIATTAAKPHIDDLALCRPGTTILHISLRDLSPDVILKCDNVVDDIEHVCRAQTSIHLTEQRVGHRDFIAGTLPEVLLGQKIHRQSATRVLVFSPFGLGILDLAVAALARQLALEHGGGQWIDGFLA